MFDTPSYFGYFDKLHIVKWAIRTLVSFVKGDFR